ncbi:MAG: response regulator [Gammaproteobacteria bacterium]
MSKKILVAEDNDQNLYLTAFLLGRHGYEIITARNGIEAVAQAQAHRPDLILMDILMPEMDGYEAIRRIKGFAETAHIPIVAVSSYAMAGDHDKAMVLGCVGYIEKPIAPETFVSQIARYL